mmetsp:Transcript_57136/g.105646  ORF Transcript_57136/g.105646 Transcript_57136/m.105646 type:complete len:390 (-) Transcript_57136:82-1251(-)
MIRAIVRWWALGLPVVLALQSQVPLSKTSISVSDHHLSWASDGKNASSSAIRTSNGDVIDKIVYLKLYNVGSSTMTGILHRYCEFHQKTCFVLPPAEPPGTVHGMLTEEDLSSILSIFQSPNMPTLDIFPNHEVMAEAELDALVPGNFKIAFLREPLGRHLSGLRHMADVQGPSVFYDLMERLQNDVAVHSCGFPRMSSQIQPNQIDDLDYVLLTEEYEHSIMMLRRVLGWSMFDMMYLELKSEHAEAVLNASSAFEEYLSQPAESHNEATRAYLQNCSGQTESLLYSRAKTTFQKQWEHFTAEEQQQIQEDTTQFIATRDLLETCCATHPEDTYCVGLLEDNPAWTERYQSQGYVYASRRVNGETVAAPVTQESECMSVVKVALSSKR